VPTTLLAVDDSVTMRKVLEITFAGEDFRVVTADSVETALAKLRAERPSIVVCDVTLDGAGGYGLCAKIKADNPAVAVVLLASKQQPYDSQKGGQARADDYIEKPFDTQQLIEKVKKLAQRPVAQEAAPAARPAPPAQPSYAPARGGGTVPMGATGRPVAASFGSASPPGGSSGRTASQVGRGTLAYGGPIPMPPAPPAQASASASRDATAPGPPPARPQAPPGPPPQPAATMAAAVPTGPALTMAVGAGSLTAGAMTSNGQLAAQLATLGLTEAQVTAVLALSREVVEKVVWEVVPVLAETMIQEEIRRLTSE
jgi:CheY-like chemotaxis protein